MPRRQPLPRLWMFTDERQSQMLWSALERLPRGSGVVFRHYSLGQQERRLLFRKVKRLCRRRGLLLLLAGDIGLGRAWRADGVYGRGADRHPTPLLRGKSVHDLAELKTAERARADVLFISPVFPTRSHPGRPTLGRRGFAALARRTRLPAIALGGMDGKRGRAMAAYAYGWAAIDAWT
ncbi:thiamine phosphate synthase [Sphingosinicella rhizophila]|uniref:Thiamine phosphate synthase n=1 Tax=Sphingosinicella rhizophila TaxID=3050082 RepID=A0ABU3Q8Y8_9SPHN|nr:thiamine phosphate synthase [Sphingosinicella sp. GR2756]MDT9599569.1 thiamine phosphate synthase [Sphingosinicella sp. GR2756]